MTRDDVLIIGAGPSGVFAAAELARHGVKARIIERDLRPHQEARATGIQPGTMEILQVVGLLQSFVDTAEHVHCARMYGPGLKELGSMNHEGIDCCCEFQLSLPQYETQRLLEQHLASLGGVIERGVTATKVEVDADGVLVELVHGEGRTETVRPRFVIGAGGAHSVTRHSMSQPLEGTTYRGNFLVADVAMPGPFPRTEAGVACGSSGLILLAPLPGGRWITFQDLEENVEFVSRDDVANRIVARLGEEFRPTDVGWHTPFRMHRRIVSRFSDGHRFLIGDAAHLSSPFGGEGLNAGLHDGFDLAWKLAPVLRGDAQPALVEGYMFERRIADYHVLDVSDHVHCSIVDVAQAARAGREIEAAVVDPVAVALVRNSRTMLDVDYWGSPLVVDHGGGSDNGPRPGKWYPDWKHFGGTLHRVLLFGEVADEATLDEFMKRWSKLVEVSLNPKVDPARAGLSSGGTVMVRPDGHIGFRFPTVDKDAIAALDRHLASYLIPDSINGPT